MVTNRNIRRSPRSKSSSVLPDTNVLSGNRNLNDCVRKTRKSAASNITLSGKRTKSIAERKRTSNSEDSATLREKKRITKPNSKNIPVTKRTSNRILALNEATYERVHGRTHRHHLRNMRIEQARKLAEEKEIRRRMMMRGREREALSVVPSSVPGRYVIKVCLFTMNLNEPVVIRETQPDGDVVNIYASRSIIEMVMNGEISISW